MVDGAENLAVSENHYTLWLILWFLTEVVILLSEQNIEWIKGNSAGCLSLSISSSFIHGLKQLGYLTNASISSVMDDDE